MPGVLHMPHPPAAASNLTNSNPDERPAGCWVSPRPHIWGVEMQDLYTNIHLLIIQSTAVPLPPASHMKLNTDYTICITTAAAPATTARLPTAAPAKARVMAASR